jgi:hypothetical protein
LNDTIQTTKIRRLGFTHILMDMEILLPVTVGAMAISPQFCLFFSHPRLKPTVKIPTSSWRGFSNVSAHLACIRIFTTHPSRGLVLDLVFSRLHWRSKYPYFLGFDASIPIYRVYYSQAPQLEHTTALANSNQTH